MSRYPPQPAPYGAAGGTKAIGRAKTQSGWIAIKSES